MRTYEVIETLTKERENRGLSLRQVAKASELSKSSIGKWESWSVQPDVESLMAWAYGLGFDLEFEMKERDDG